MKRSSLVAAVRQILEAGRDATDVVLVVRLRAPQLVPGADGLREEFRVGIFGDDMPGAQAFGMLSTARDIVRNERRLVDSSDALCAAVEKSEGLKN